MRHGWDKTAERAPAHQRRSMVGRQTRCAGAPLRQLVPPYDYEFDSPIMKV